MELAFNPEGPGHSHPFASRSHSARDFIIVNTILDLDLSGDASETNEAVIQISRLGEIRFEFPNVAVSCTGLGDYLMGRESYGQRGGDDLGRLLCRVLRYVALSTGGCLPPRNVLDGGRAEEVLLMKLSSGGISEKGC